MRNNGNEKPTAAVFPPRKLTTEEVSFLSKALVSKKMNDKTIYDEPSEVDAEEGIVLVNGPDAVEVRLTPEAAEETSERLNTGAMKARGQRYFSDPRKD